MCLLYAMLLVDFNLQAVATFKQREINEEKAIYIYSNSQKSESNSGNVKKYESYPKIKNKNIW